MNALRLGLRLAVTGGRNARMRAAMTAAGVALGMVVLLVAAAVPNMVNAIDNRQAARSTLENMDGRPELRVADAYTRFREDEIRGQRLQPLVDGAPAPPGLRALPGPGELAVSPALRDLLADEPLLRERLDGPVVATIGAEGLIGPRELVFYAGADDIARSEGYEASGFGYEQPTVPLPAFLVLIVAVGVVVLLLPVGVFIATAVRFGSDERDRRLAALRLVGADRAMAVRIAAGEALAGCLAGMALGFAAFFALRPLAERLHLQDLSVYATDIRPAGALVALIAVAVPAAALVASVFALRRVVVEPLGVTRQAARVRRRLAWRLVPVGLGALMLGSRAGDLVRSPQDPAVAPIAIGVGLMLVGVVALLPWLVDAVVARMGGGGVPRLLAIRRLQMDGGTAARAVAGVSVAVAGAIALQTVLAEGQRASTFTTGADLARSDARAGMLARDAGARDVLAALEATPGVSRATAVSAGYRATTAYQVGDCKSLREYAVIGRCENGDMFSTGRRLRHERFADAQRVPIRPAPDGYDVGGYLLTPAAARGLRLDTTDAFIKLDRTVPDALDRVRNALADLSPTASAYAITETTELSAYRTVRRGIFIGAFVVLALIAASLFVGGLEQLRERRPVLAALSAFGVPRGALARSILWQAAVPVVLALVVSVSVGLALGALLLRVGDQELNVDWRSVLLMTGAGAAVIAAVTIATLPALSRLMRPEGLRAE